MIRIFSTKKQVIVLSTIGDLTMEKQDFLALLKRYNIGFARLVEICNGYLDTGDTARETVNAWLYQRKEPNKTTKIAFALIAKDQGWKY